MVGPQIVALVVWVQFPVFTLYAVVMELVYVFDSKSKFCGFESRPPYLPMPGLKHLIAIMMLVVKHLSSGWLI